MHIDRRQYSHLGIISGVTVMWLMAVYVMRSDDDLIEGDEHGVFIMCSLAMHAVWIALWRATSSVELINERVGAIVAACLVAIIGSELVVDTSTTSPSNSSVADLGVILAALFAPTVVAFYHLVDEGALIKRIVVSKLMRSITTTVVEHVIALPLRVQCSIEDHAVEVTHFYRRFVDLSVYLLVQLVVVVGKLAVFGFADTHSSSVFSKSVTASIAVYVVMYCVLRVSTKTNFRICLHKHSEVFMILFCHAGISFLLILLGERDLPTALSVLYFPLNHLLKQDWYYDTVEQFPYVFNFLRL